MFIKNYRIFAALVLEKEVCLSGIKYFTQFAGY